MWLLSLLLAGGSYQYKLCVTFLNTLKSEKFSLQGHILMLSRMAGQRYFRLCILKFPSLVQDAPNGTPEQMGQTTNSQQLE